MATTITDPIERIISQTFWYSRAFGMGNVSFDFETRQIIFNRKTIVYSLIVDILLLISLPVIVVRPFGFTDIDLVTERPLALKTNRIVVYINAFTIGVTLISQWVNLSCAKGIFQRLNSVPAAPRHKKPSKIQRKILQLIYLKIISSFFMVTGTFVTVLSLKANHSYRLVLEALYLSLLENLLMIVESEFCIGMLYGAYQFCLLNRRLLKLVKDMNIIWADGERRISRQASRHLCDELVTIGRHHTNFHKLTIDFMGLFQIQILAILITFFAMQISMMFYFVVLLNGSFADLIKMEFLTASGGVVMSLVDLWLIVYICGVVVSACNAPGNILMSLATHNILNRRLVKCIEMLSFQMKQEKLRLTLCGLFDLDWSTGFVITKASFMKVILLVQLDYKNFQQI